MTTLELVNEREPSDELGGCSQVVLEALSPGFATLRVNYRYLGLEGRPVVLRDEITVGAYNPLTPVQPSLRETGKEGVVVLALESSLDIVWSGGPKPWINKPESHFYDIAVDQGQDQSVEIRSQRSWPSGLYVYKATCLKLGEARVTLTVGNRPSEDIVKPQVSTSTVTVVCAQPDRVKLKAANQEKDCPLAGRTGRIAALSHSHLTILTSVYDSQVSSCFLVVVVCSSLVVVSCLLYLVC